MIKINTSGLTEDAYSSPDSTDLLERHPFDVSIVRVPAGRRNWPYHAHSSQWEFYHVISGTGKLRHKEGLAEIQPGGAFICATYYPDSDKYAVRILRRRRISVGLK